MTEPRIHGRQSLEVRVQTHEATSQAAVLDAYDAHHDEIWAYVLGSTRDGPVAEDLVQEVFLRLQRETRAGRMPSRCGLGCTGWPPTSSSAAVAG